MVARWLYHGLGLRLWGGWEKEVAGSFTASGHRDCIELGKISKSGRARGMWWFRGLHFYRYNKCVSERFTKNAIFFKKS